MPSNVDAVPVSYDMVRSVTLLITLRTGSTYAFSAALTSVTFLTQGLVATP